MDYKMNICRVLRGGLSIMIHVTCNHCISHFAFVLPSGIVDLHSRNHKDDCFCMRKEGMWWCQSTLMFNMTAADAQSAQLVIGGLWVWYSLGLNVWPGFEYLQVWVLTCHLVVWPNFDCCLRIIPCIVDFDFLLGWMSIKYSYFTSVCRNS